MSRAWLPGRHQGYRPGSRTMAQSQATEDREPPIPPRGAGGGSRNAIGDLLPNQGPLLTRAVAQGVCVRSDCRALVVNVSPGPKQRVVRQCANKHVQSVEIEAIRKQQERDQLPGHSEWRANEKVLATERERALKEVQRRHAELQQVNARYKTLRARRRQARRALKLAMLEYRNVK